jgi:threonine synthase
MMGRLMNYYLQKQDRHLIILTATSGDTGSAVAHAFLGLDRIKVVVLFPEGEVTDRQRKQMTTLGQNIQVISMKGKFDDCQALVKQAFADPELAHLPLSSANSINIGRLIPQSVYYVYAWSRLSRGKEKVIFSVPSGNFGDMMGGMLAMKMGLPIEKFIIAVNANDEFPIFLQSGNYQKIEPSIHCISSAMNVGHPSNLARLVALYGGVMDETGVIHKQADLEALNRDVFAVSVSDEDTRKTIQSAWKKYRLLLEPHGAVGWYGLHQFPGGHSDPLCVTLETAHPAKFPGEIQHLLGFDPPLPPGLEGLEAKEETYLSLSVDYWTFKDMLLSSY